MQISRQLFAEITGRRVVTADPPDVEKRDVDRMALPESIVVIPTDGEAVGDPTFSKLRDISYEGVGFLSCIQAKKGSVCLVRLPRKQDYVWIYCDVVRCEPSADGLFMVGATFKRLLRSTEKLPERSGASRTEPGVVQ